MIFYYIKNIYHILPSNIKYFRKKCYFFFPKIKIKKIDDKIEIRK